MNPTWENTFDCQKFVSLMGAGLRRDEINVFVLRETTYEFFLFNGIVYIPGYRESKESGWVLNTDTREFETLISN